MRRRRWLRRTGRSLIQQQATLFGIAREQRRPLELLPRLVEPPQLHQEIGSHRGQQVIGLERGFLHERIHQLQPGGRTEGHGHGHGAVQFHHRRRLDLGQCVIERHDAFPVGLRGGAGAGMAGGDLRLQHVRS